VLFLSYWQTITAYPGNGGSYTVARENLGARAGLLAAALMLDHMLNVAVRISAGGGRADIRDADAARASAAAMPRNPGGDHADEPAWDRMWLW